MFKYHITALQAFEGKRDFGQEGNVRGRGGGGEEGGLERPTRRPLFSCYKHPPDECQNPNRSVFKTRQSQPRYLIRLAEINIIADLSVII